MGIDLGVFVPDLAVAAGGMAPVAAACLDLASAVVGAAAHDWRPSS